MDAVDQAIDQGEAWAAVLGLKPLRDKTIKEVTPRQVAEVADLPSVIAKAAKALCSGTGAKRTPIKLVDYERVVREFITEPFDEVAFEMLIRPLPDDVELAYLTVAQCEFVSIQKILPVSSYQTFSGSHSLKPGLAALLKFSALYAAFEDPVSFLFGAIGDGSLDKDVVLMVRSVFNTLCQAIEDAIREEVISRIQKNPNYTLPRNAEIGMAVWMGQAPVGPVVAPPQQQQAPGQTSGGSDKATTDTETPGQSIES